jgi:hypothetical protein
VVLEAFIVSKKKQVAIRDTPLPGRPVVLGWANRIWRGADYDFTMQASTETNALRLEVRSVPTGPIEIRRRADGYGHGEVVPAARAFGVDWHACLAAVRNYGTPGRPEGDHGTDGALLRTGPWVPTHLLPGIDEHLTSGLETTSRDARELVRGAGSDFGGSQCLGHARITAIPH